jgi:hypothetical protein
LHPSPLALLPIRTPPHSLRSSLLPTHQVTDHNNKKAAHATANTEYVAAEAKAATDGDAHSAQCTASENRQTAAADAQKAKDTTFFNDALAFVSELEDKLVAFQGKAAVVEDEASPYYGMCTPGQDCTDDASCGGKAWCNLKADAPAGQKNKYFEGCHATATKAGADIKRKDIFFCDYGTEEPLAPSVFLTLGETMRLRQLTDAFATTHGAALRYLDTTARLTGLRADAVAEIRAALAAVTTSIENEMGSVADLHTANIEKIENEGKACLESTAFTAIVELYVEEEEEEKRRRGGGEEEEEKRSGERRYGCVTPCCA